MHDRLSACLLLCDDFYEDRGKLSILGYGWTETRPGRRSDISFAVAVSVASPSEDDKFNLVVRLLGSNDDTPIFEGTLAGQLDTPEPGLLHASSLVPLLLPEVQLEPSSVYFVQLLHEGQLLTSVSFRTTGEPTRAVD